MADSESENKTTSAFVPTPHALIEWVERLAKLGALLGLFGYMSLRATWNYLGVHNAASLGAERYLAEIYPLLTHTLLSPRTLISLLLCLLPAGFLVLAVWWIRKAANRLRHRGNSVNFAGTVPIDVWFSSLWNRPPMTLLLVLVMALFYVRLQQWFSDHHLPRSAVLIGKLKVLELTDVDGEGLFRGITVVCLLGYALMLHALRSSAALPRDVNWRWNRGLWAIFGVLMVSVVLHIPLVYAYGVRPPHYYQVQVLQDGKTRPLEGTLLLETETHLSLWHTSQGIGTIIRIPRDSVTSLKIVNPVNVIQQARAAALAAEIRTLRMAIHKATRRVSRRSQRARPATAKPSLRGSYP